VRRRLASPPALRYPRGVTSHADANRQRIALVRHARSAHVHRGWISAAGFRDWRQAYESAGILETESPPADLRRLAESADLVLSSDAPRAVATARKLAPGREIAISALLGELDLDPPGLGRLAMPLPLWALAVGLRVLASRVRGQYPSRKEAARLDQAVRWLLEQAGRHRTVVVVTHGSFRRELFALLARGGWLPEPGRRTSRHWSAWQLTRSSGD
jgi:broad specificity phosphatase PhoE